MLERMSSNEIAPLKHLNAVPFVLASVHGGTMIVNRLDFHPLAAGRSALGPGTELLTTGHYDNRYIPLLGRMLELIHATRGDGLIAIDGGANIGTYTLPLARQLELWGGVVLAFEPQEWVYYALAGNIAINNCINAKATMAALTAEPCSIAVPQLDPRKPAGFSGVTLNPALWTDVGQDNSVTAQVPGVSIDTMKLKRLDLLKLDIEGMELEALTGGIETIRRCRPVIFAENFLTPADKMQELLGSDWDELFAPPMMSFFTHKEDKAGEFSP
jgi:FkbM family methyltransferase